MQYLHWKKPWIQRDLIMGAYQFEESTDAYLPAVLELYNHYVQNTTCTFHTKPLTLARLRELMIQKNPKYKAFVILQEVEFYGYVFLSQHKKREAYDGTAEVSVYLKPESIGKGLGTLALQHIEQFALSMKLHVLVATICSENEKSVQLFEKNGYTKCAHYKEIGKKFGRWLDVVAFQKILK